MVPDGWHLLALMVPNVSLPQLIFRVLSKKALGRKTGLKSVCEDKEGIKEQPSWKWPWQQGWMELGWPLAVGKGWCVTHCK